MRGLGEEDPLETGLAQCVWAGRGGSVGGTVIDPQVVAILASSSYHFLNTFLQVVPFLSYCSLWQSIPWGCIAPAQIHVSLRAEEMLGKLNFQGVAPALLCYRHPRLPSQILSTEETG